MKLLTTMIYDFIMRLIMMIVDVFFNFFNMNFNQISRDYHILKLGGLTLMDSSVSNKQKLKIRFREILELVLMVGCGIPICSGVYGGFLVLSPMVLLILGAFALAGVAHFLMTNTWKTECEGSFCYKNNGKLSFVFTLLKLEVVLFILPIALSTIVLGLLQVFNPAVALVLGTVSLAIFSRVALLRWGQSKNDQNRENSNDACKYDFDLSERIWLKFMTITFPIACALLLLSALAGILSFATAGVCCIPFGGIGLFTGICFLWSKYHKPNKRSFLNENHNMSNDMNVRKNDLDFMNSQTHTNSNIDLNKGSKPELPTLEEIEEAKKNELKDKGFNGDFDFSSGTGNPSQEQKGYYNINEI